MNVSLASPQAAKTHSPALSNAPVNSNIENAGVKQVSKAVDNNLVGLTVTNPNANDAIAKQEQSQQIGKPLEHSPRLDIDEKALAAVEQLGLLDTQQENSLPVNISASQGNEFKQSSNNSGYDKPSDQNQTAVSAYQSVGSQEKRESVQQVFGVDLFA